MRRSLPSTVRDIVLLALAPVSIPACAGKAEQQSPGVDASALADSGPDPSAPVDSGPDTEASSSGGNTDAAADAMKGPSCLGGCDGGCARPCDSSAYSDGGTGACAPRWVQGNGCSYGDQVLFPCGLPPDAGPSCTPYCMGNDFFSWCPVVTDAGWGPEAPYADAGTTPTVVQCSINCTGRRPATLIDEPSPGVRTIGQLLASMAYLEAASVPAFLDLAEQLEANGAPRALVRRARRAAQDEVRHARQVGALARARGAEPPVARVAETGVRRLLALALENAREGCVRETWGAAVAVAQSVRAADRDVRDAMRGIARDELRHAALAWDLASWLESRLRPEERACVREERARAIAWLEGEIERELPAPWQVALGTPTPAEARAIARGMSLEVWAAAA
jgi:hypothetical protein